MDVGWVVSAEGSRQLLLLEISEQRFAVGIDAVREVLPLAELSRPLGLPGILLGFLNRAGQALPVVDPRRLFQLADDRPLGVYAHLVVIKGPPALALLVDRAVRTIDVEAEALLPVAASHSFNDCTACEAHIGAETIPVLRVENLLLAAERTRIGQLRAIEDERLRDLKEVEG